MLGLFFLPHSLGVGSINRAGFFFLLMGVTSILIFVSVNIILKLSLNTIMKRLYSKCQMKRKQGLPVPDTEIVFYASVFCNIL